MKYSISSVHKNTDKPHYYIQSHGNNAGQPLRKPIPNSFQVICESPEDVELMFYTTKMLFVSRSFWILLRGSVIPFIALYECKKTLKQGLEVTLRSRKQFQKLSSAMNQIEARVAANLEQNKQLKDLELSLLQNYRITKKYP